jgi:hypothetical protein
MQAGAGVQIEGRRLGELLCPEPVRARRRECSLAPAIAACQSVAASTVKEPNRMQIEIEYCGM